MAAQPLFWDLLDLAAVGDLADMLGVTRPTVANWPARYEDFPAPLTTLSNGTVYSRAQVRQWHDRRWPPAAPKSGRRRNADRAMRE